MESTEIKTNQIIINKKELNLLSLIEEDCFKTNGFLPNYSDSNCDKTSFLISNNIESLIFSPNYKLNGLLKESSFTKKLSLTMNGCVVGEISDIKIFKNDKKNTSIFNEDICKVEENLNPCISGKVKIFDNKIKKIKLELAAKIKKYNAKKVTALVLNADPVTRAHERMFRWTIDKADLILVFITESYRQKSIDFKVKKECFDFFIKNFLPQERIFPIYLQGVDLFNPHLDPNYECLLASSFGANKLVIGQNHQGLGLFYDKNLAHTAIDELSKKTGLELIVLPEFVFCNKCNMMVSTKSCPHGSHHHIKYRSSVIREMLQSGLIPPTVLVRKEISAKLLAHLHPNRFKNVQMIYDGLFPSNGIIEKRSDEDLYKELINLYRTGYMI